MYPYPPMYMQPPQPARTPGGVKWSLVAFVIYLVYLTVGILVAIYAYTVLSNLNPTDPFAFFSAIAGLLIASIVSVILGICVLVFYFIGLGYLYGGRNEMGPAHARNLKFALALAIVALSLDLTGRIVSYVIASSAFQFDFFSGRITFNPNALYLGVAVSTSVGIVVAALVAATLVLSIRALAKPTHSPLLYAAAGIGTATPGIAGALALLQLPGIVQTIEDLIDSGPFGGFTGFPLDASMGIPAVVMGGLGLLAGILYFFVYRNVAERLRTGELKPVLPPPTPMSPWGAPMAPYPYAPAPAAPPAPVHPAEPPVQPPA